MSTHVVGSWLRAFKVSSKSKSLCEKSAMKHWAWAAWCTAFFPRQVCSVMTLLQCFLGWRGHCLWAQKYEPVPSGGPLWTNNNVLNVTRAVTQLHLVLLCSRPASLLQWPLGSPELRIFFRWILSPSHLWMSWSFSSSKVLVKFLFQSLFPLSRCYWRIVWIALFLC